jgi:hypothetical protein
MGRFFQWQMFREAAAEGYDYLWRLDADIEMRLGIPCDVFDIMVRSRAVLGYYYYSDYDHHNCGLWQGRNATYAYADRHGSAPASPAAAAAAAAADRHGSAPASPPLPLAYGRRCGRRPLWWGLLPLACMHPCPGCIIECAAIGERHVRAEPM